MTKRLLALAVSAATLTGAATSPASADWLRRGYGYGLGYGGGWHEHYYHPHHHGGFGPGVALGPGLIAPRRALLYNQPRSYYGWPPIYYAPPRTYYVPPPVYYQRG
jgi:hypothetical protein